MSLSSETILPEPKVSLEDLRLIDALCSQLESNWKSDRHKPAEVLASNSTVKNRAALVESLVRSELELRDGTKSELELMEFLARFPSDGNAVRRAFIPVEELEKIDATLPTSVLQSKAKMPATMGPYQILEQFARGGMGVIYRARHMQLDRVVALKVILTGQLASEIEIARFRKESHTIASLDHPNIVPIYDVGESEGFHYFSMPLLEGDNLADRIHEHPLHAQQAAKWVLEIANAVSFAHQHGVIHRDLKPRNILLDASGKACVTDFGLAKVVSDRSEEHYLHGLNIPELTMSGEVVGTPGYMAPEQAAGKPTSASDVYSIGAVLYAMLTGRPPFQAATLIETLRQVQDKEPVEPRRLNATIPRDLETIVLKCLSKNPKLRYETAAALSADLERFIEGKPISARATSKFEHAWRWVKRNPVVAGLSSAVFVSLLIGLCVSLWFYSLASSREELATQNFGIALSTVKKYLTDVATSPELKSKGLEPLRRNLLKTAQEFYEQLEKQSKDAVAKERLTDAQYNLGEINLELGNWREADRYFQQSIEGLESQVDGSANKSTLLLQVGNTYQMQAESRKHSDSKAWEEAIQAALKIYRDLNARSKSPTSMLGIASTLADFGIHLENTDRASESVEAFKEVDEMCRELRQQMQVSADTYAAKRLLKIIDFLALHKQQHGKFVEAEEWLLASEDLAKSLIKFDPEDQQLIYRLARVYKNLNMIYSRLQRFDDSESRFQQSHEIFQQLTREHPLVHEYLDDNATLCMNRAVTLAQRGEFGGSAAAMQTAYLLQLELVTKKPDDFKSNWGIGLLCSNYGNVLQKTGELGESESKLGEAVGYFSKAKRIDPNDKNLILGMTSCQLNLGNLYRDQGKIVESKGLFESAVDALTELISKVPSVIGFRKSCVVGNINLATSCRELREFDRAIAAISAGKAMSEKLVEEQPDSVEFQSLFASVLTAESEVWTDTGDLQSATNGCEQALEILRNLIKTAESGDRFRISLAIALSDLTRIQLREEKFLEALQTSEQALEAYGFEMRVRAGKSAAENRQIRERLCWAHRDRARALFGLKRLEQAKSECELGLGFQTGSQADSLRALHARILSVLSDSNAAKNSLREITPSKRLDYQGYLDQAAAYAIMSPESLSSECLESLQKVREADAARFQAAINEPEFQKIRNSPQLKKLRDL